MILISNFGVPIVDKYINYTMNVYLIVYTVSVTLAVDSDTAESFSINYKSYIN